MITRSATTTIRRPLADVFTFVATDYFVNHPRWDSAVVSLELATPGPVVIGTHGREVRAQGGRNVAYDFEVTRLEPNNRIGINASGGGAKFSAAYAVRSVSESESELTIELSLAMGGLFRIMEPFISGSFCKEVDELGPIIKGMIEAQPT